MPIRSAGLLLYRTISAVTEVLLVHPGGPFWANKDNAAWSVPKGIVEQNEDELVAARREAREELGVEVAGPFEFLGEYKQPGGKVVVIWVVPTDGSFEAKVECGSTFAIEWPPKSGKQANFPEVDRAEWFPVDVAGSKIHKGQRPILVDFLAFANVGRA